MAGDTFWAGVLAERVVALCEEQNIWETECEYLVREWIQQIDEEFRPTEVQVIMAAKRKIYGLVPI